MSLTSTSNRVTATGDGVTTLFNYNKLLYSSTHLQVYLDSVLQTTSYTVGGVPGTSTSVTFSAAPANGVQVLMLRVVPLTQLSVYAVGGAFPAATTEKNLDLAVMGLQQFDDTTNRTLRQPVTDTANIATIPVKASRASMYLAFDANGDPVATTGTAETPNALLKTGGNLTGGVNEARGNITQHATTMDFFATTNPGILDGTGSAVTITACVNAPQGGATRKFYPIVATVLTHGATFDCVGNANLTAAAGDCWIIEAKTVSTYRVTAAKEDGTAVVSSATTDASLLTSGTLAVARLPSLGNARVVLTSGNITTTSTSLVDLTGATITFTTGAYPVHVALTGVAAMGATGQTFWINVDIDGALQLGTAGIQIDELSGGYYMDISFAFNTAALTAASHTIKVQWKVSGGTGTVLANSANALILSAHELR